MAAQGPGPAVAPNDCSHDFQHAERYPLPGETVHLDALHVLVEGNGHSDIDIVGLVYADAGGRPSDILGSTAPVLLKKDAPRQWLQLPFAYPGGQLSITPHFAGESVWVGEISGAPAETATRGEGEQTQRIPPGPADLACYGITGGGHQPCFYTPHPFAAGPMGHWSGGQVGSSSLSIYATLKT